MPASATLTSRQRVNRMFQRRDHDRIPRCETFWSDTIQRWQREGLDGDATTVAAMLQSDFHGICWIAPAIFPNQREVISQDEKTQLVRDAFGKTVRHWKNRSGTPEH